MKQFIEEVKEGTRRDYAASIDQDLEFLLHVALYVDRGISAMEDCDCAGGLLSNLITEGSGGCRKIPFRYSSALPKVEETEVNDQKMRWAANLMLGSLVLQSEVKDFIRAIIPHISEPGLNLQIQGDVLRIDRTSPDGMSGSWTKFNLAGAEALNELLPYLGGKDVPKYNELLPRTERNLAIWEIAFRALARRSDLIVIQGCDSDSYPRSHCGFIDYVSKAIPE